MRGQPAGPSRSRGLACSSRFARRGRALLCPQYIPAGPYVYVPFLSRYGMGIVSQESGVTPMHDINAIVAAMDRATERGDKRFLRRHQLASDLDIADRPRGRPSERVGGRRGGVRVVTRPTLLLGLGRLWPMRKLPGCPCPCCHGRRLAPLEFCLADGCERSGVDGLLAIVPYSERPRPLGADARGLRGGLVGSRRKPKQLRGA